MHHFHYFPIEARAVEKKKREKKTCAWRGEGGKEMYRLSRLQKGKREKGGGRGGGSSRPWAEREEGKGGIGKIYSLGEE